MATKRSEGEILFSHILKELSVPGWEEEYVFFEGRRFRFDFAWPNFLIAVEIEGGTYSMGRHTRGSGFAKDCEKYNLAALDGWQVYRFTTGMVKDGSAKNFMKQVFQYG